MHDGWVQTPIGDVAQVLSGFAFKSELFNKTEGIPLIRIRDLPKGDSTEALYSGSYEDRYVVKKGDFLIGMDGEFHCYEWNGPDALLNQRVCRIQDFKLSIVIPRYIYFAVNQYLDKIEQETGYTTVKHISAKQVLGITIPLPPLPEQKRIVDLISSVDSYIEALQQQLESTKKSRNAVLHELLTMGGDDWVETKLGEVAEWWSGGTPKAREPKYYENGTIPWAVIADMNKGVIESTNSCITEEAFALIGGRLAPVGSVLISMYASVGKSAIANVPLATNQAIAWSIPNQEKILPFFLYLVSQQLEKKISDLARGATQRNINRQMLREFTFQLPPLTEQRKIVEIISIIDELKDKTEITVFEAKNLRSGLLSDLLSGKHKIPVSYDKVMGAA
jgi:type I restriction enzyme S subunit